MTSVLHPCSPAFGPHMFSAALRPDSFGIQKSPLKMKPKTCSTPKSSTTPRGYSPKASAEASAGFAALGAQDQQAAAGFQPPLAAAPPPQLHDGPSLLFTPSPPRKDIVINNGVCVQLDAAARSGDLALIDSCIR